MDAVTLETLVRFFPSLPVNCQIVRVGFVPLVRHFQTFLMNCQHTLLHPLPDSFPAWHKKKRTKLAKRTPGWGQKVLVGYVPFVRHFLALSANCHHTSSSDSFLARQGKKARNSRNSHRAGD